MKKNKGFIKFIIFSALMLCYYAYEQTVSPIIANQLAMQQMQNYDTSSMGIQLYTYLTNYSWIAFIIVFIGMFRKDIAELIKIIKEKQNEEE